MTSTLPTFSASSANPPAGSCGFNFAAMTGSASASGTGAAATPPPGEGVMPEFAALLADAPSAAPQPAAPAVPASPAPLAAPVASPVAVANGMVAPAVTETATTLPVMRPGTTARAGRPAAPSLSTRPTTEPLVSFSTQGQVVSGTVSMISIEKENAPVHPDLISREEFERAAAFVAALMQALEQAAPPAPTLPEETGVAGESVTIAAPETSPGTSFASQTQGSPKDPAGLVLPNGQPFPAHLPTQAKPSFTSQRALADTPASSPVAGVVEIPMGQGGAVASTPADLAPTLPEFTVGADGAIELKLDFPATP
ncbi:MAG TPA: hypothetical protein VHN79_04335, partial [Lacunisphaera sp.]|nr:hypothetical protein [Lacunisphaera sp.]